MTTSQGELTSADGESWQFVPGPVPDAYVAGHFAQFVSVQPTVWLAGDSMPRPIKVSSGPGPTLTRSSSLVAEFVNGSPANVDFSWSDGVDCTNARCLVIHSKPYWVP